MTQMNTIQLSVLNSTFARKIAGEKPKALATEIGVPVQRLMAEWKRAGLFNEAPAATEVVEAPVTATVETVETFPLSEIAVEEKNDDDIIHCNNCGCEIDETTSGMCEACEVEFAACPSKSEDEDAKLDAACAAVANLIHRPLTESEIDSRVESELQRMEDEIEISREQEAAAPVAPVAAVAEYDINVVVKVKWLSGMLDGKKVWLTERQWYGLKALTEGSTKIPQDLYTQLKLKSFAVRVGEEIKATELGVATLTAIVR